jgi:hypothetical protein
MLFDVAAYVPLPLFTILPLIFLANAPSPYLPIPHLFTNP